MPNGFDAGPMYCDSSYSNMAEVVGRQPRRRSASAPSCSRSSAPPSSPATATRNTRKGIIQAASGAFGNAATRLAAFVVKGGAYAYGSYPDIDELYPQQADELDHEKRAAILDKMQQLVHEKAIYAPIWQLGFHQRRSARGSAKSGFGLIPGFAYTAPFEDLTIKG